MMTVCIRLTLLVEMLLALGIMTTRGISSLRPVIFSTMVADDSGITETYEMGVESMQCNTNQPTYSVFCGVNLDIFVRDPVNGIDLNIGHHTAAHPVWSADGQLAWQSFRDDDWEIYLWDSMNGSLINISRDPNADMMPVFSVDGQLAWMSERQGDGGEIYVWDAINEQALNVTHHPAADRSPVWTRDGHLGWLSNRDGRLGLYVFAPDQIGGEVMRVCDDRANFGSLPMFDLNEIILCDVTATEVGSD